MRTRKRDIADRIFKRRETKHLPEGGEGKRPFSLQGHTQRPRYTPWPCPCLAKDPVLPPISLMLQNRIVRPMRLLWRPDS